MFLIWRFRSVTEMNANVISSSATETGEVIKSISNATWLYRGLGGKECCRKPYEPCGHNCKTMWRLWITILIGILVISGVTNIGMAFWIFSPLETHPNFFISLRMKRVLILSPGHLPMPYMLLNLIAIWIGVWAFIMMMIRCLAGFVCFSLYRCVQLLLNLGVGMLFVLQVVYGWGDWPDQVAIDFLNKRMETQLVSQDVQNGLVSVNWTDTQTLFECCGIHSYQDWYKVPKVLHQNQVTRQKNLKILPYSCCKDFTERDYCYEALSSSLHTRGCLSPQVEMLKWTWLFLAASTLLLFLSLCTLSRTVLIFFIKFPCDDNSKKAVSSTSRGMYSPPPRPKKKKKALFSETHVNEEDEDVPLLSARNSSNVTEGKMLEAGIYQMSYESLENIPDSEEEEQPETMVLYKSGSELTVPSRASVNQSMYESSPTYPKQPATSPSSATMPPKQVQAKVPSHIYPPTVTSSQRNSKPKPHNKTLIPLTNDAKSEAPNNRPSLPSLLQDESARSEQGGN